MGADASTDQFKLNHLRRRIAQITVAHEDALADAAIREQLLLQTVQERDAQIENLTAQIEEMRSLQLEKQDAPESADD